MDSTQPGGVYRSVAIRDNAVDTATVGVKEMKMLAPREEIVSHVRQHGVSFITGMMIGGVFYDSVGVSYGQVNGVEFGPVWVVRLSYDRARSIHGDYTLHLRREEVARPVPQAVD